DSCSSPRRLLRWVGGPRTYGRHREHDERGVCNSRFNRTGLGGKGAVPERECWRWWEHGEHGAGVAGCGEGGRGVERKKSRLGGVGAHRSGGGGEGEGEGKGEGESWDGA